MNFKRAMVILVSLLFIPNLVFAISASELVAEINAERASRGLSVLLEDSRLDKAGENKSRALRDRGLLEHTKTAEGVPWSYVAETGYEYSSAGENLAVAVDGDFNVLEDWLQSSAHRENVLNKNYVNIGVGITKGTFGGTSAEYVVAYFATPKQSDNLHKSEISGNTDTRIEIMKRLITLLTELINQILANRV